MQSMCSRTCKGQGQDKYTASYQGFLRVVEKETAYSSRCAYYKAQDSCHSSEAIARRCEKTCEGCKKDRCRDNIELSRPYKARTYKKKLFPSRCAYYKLRGSCTSRYIQTKCSKTCKGSGSDHPSFSNKYEQTEFVRKTFSSRCKYYQHSGYCQSSHVRAMCSKTCKAKGKDRYQTSYIANVNIVEKETPYSSRCAYYKATGKCGLYSSRCMKTCGTCDTVYKNALSQLYAGVACSDRSTPGVCAMYQRRNYCSKVHFKNICKQTCGACSGHWNEKWLAINKTSGDLQWRQGEWEKRKPNEQVWFGSGQQHLCFLQTCERDNLIKQVWPCSESLQEITKSTRTQAKPEGETCFIRQTMRPMHECRQQLGRRFRKLSTHNSLIQCLEATRIRFMASVGVVNRQKFIPRPGDEIQLGRADRARWIEDKWAQELRQGIHTALERVRNKLPALAQSAGCEGKQLRWTTEVKFMPHRSIFGSTCSLKKKANPTAHVPTVTVVVDRSPCAEHLVSRGVMSRMMSVPKSKYRKAAHAGSCKTGLPLGYPQRLGKDVTHEHCGKNCDAKKDCNSYAFNSQTSECVLYSGKCEVIQRTLKNYVPYVKVYYQGGYVAVTKSNYSAVSLKCLTFGAMIISGKVSTHQPAEGGLKIGIMVNLTSMYLQPANDNTLYLQPPAAPGGAAKKAAGTESDMTISYGKGSRSKRCLCDKLENCQTIKGKGQPGDLGNDGFDRCASDKCSGSGYCPQFKELAKTKSPGECVALARADPECKKTKGPTQTNRWCNGQKTSAGMTNPTGKTPAACIALCQAVPAGGWFGFRRNDRHCEFWTPNSCGKGGHVQAGHDIYKVPPAGLSKKAFSLDLLGAAPDYYYTKQKSEFVTWDKCKQNRVACDLSYEKCKHEAFAACTGNCVAVAVKKLGGHFYLTYTNTGCVKTNTVKDSHWDLYTKKSKAIVGTAANKKAAGAPSLFYEYRLALPGGANTDCVSLGLDKQLRFQPCNHTAKEQVFRFVPKEDGPGTFYLQSIVDNGPCISHDLKASSEASKLCQGTEVEWNMLSKPKESWQPDTGAMVNEKEEKRKARVARFYKLKKLLGQVNGYSEATELTFGEMAATRTTTIKKSDAISKGSTYNITAGRRRKMMSSRMKKRYQHAAQFDAICQQVRGAIDNELRTTLHNIRFQMAMPKCKKSAKGGNE